MPRSPLDTPGISQGSSQHSHTSPAVGWAQLLGVEAATLLPVTVPALRIHKSRTALSLEAQGGLCTPCALVSASWGRAVLGVDGCLEQAEGNQCWGPKCLRRQQGRGSQEKDQTSDSTSSFPSSMLTSQSGHKGLEPCGQV